MNWKKNISILPIGLLLIVGNLFVFPVAALLIADEMETPPVYDVIWNEDEDENTLDATFQTVPKDEKDQRRSSLTVTAEFLEDQIENELESELLDILSVKDMIVTFEPGAAIELSIGGTLTLSNSDVSFVLKGSDYGGIWSEDPIDIFLENRSVLRFDLVESQEGTWDFVNNYHIGKDGATLDISGGLVQAGTVTGEGNLSIINTLPTGISQEGAAGRGEDGKWYHHFTTTITEGEDEVEKSVSHWRVWNPAAMRWDTIKTEDIDEENLPIDIDTTYTPEEMKEFFQNMKGQFEIAELGLEGVLTISNAVEVILAEGEHEALGITVNAGGTLIVEAGAAVTLGDEAVGNLRVRGELQVSVLAGESESIFENTVLSGDGLVIKEGDGNWTMGQVNLVYSTSPNSPNYSFGTLDVREGDIHLTYKEGTNVLGTLLLASGSTLTGLDGDEEKKSDLSIGKESTIEGIISDIGSLSLSGGVHSFLGKAHTIDNITIFRGATLHLEGGSIQLADVPLLDDKGEPVLDDDDDPVYRENITVSGTLKLSDGAVLTKEDGGDIHITLQGSTHNNNINGDVTGGILEINDNYNAPEIHTTIGVIGKISVAHGVTFQGGTIGTAKNADAGHLAVDGGGTLEAGTVDLGKGFMMVHDLYIFDEDNEQTGREGTTVILKDTLTAGGLLIDKESTVFADKSVTVGAVEIRGNYTGVGEHAHLTVENGGTIWGNVEVEKFTLGGDLILVVVPQEQGGESTLMNAAGAMISVETWEFADSEKPSTIRVHAWSGFTGNLIQVNDGNIGSLLDALDKSETALYKPTWSIQDEIYLHLDLLTLSVQDYVGQGKNNGQNLKRIAWLIDQNAQKDSYFQNDLLGLNHAQLQGFFRSMLAGEVAGNAFRIAMQQPSQSIFRHLDTVAPLNPSFGRGLTGQTRGQTREGFNTWFNAFGQAETAEKTAGTYDGYDMSRYGFHLGGDVEIYKRAVAGAFFGYTNPQVKSGLGKITANDFAAGLYLRMPFVEEVMTNMMVGFGSQDYTYKNGYGSSDFRGSSLFGSVEMTRAMRFKHFRLTPLIAIDVQSAMMDDFLVYDPLLQDAGVISIAPDDLSSASVRIGLLGEAGRIRTRLQYMRQIAGDDIASSKTSIIGLGTSAATQVRGTPWGKDWVNVGIGGELLQTRYWRIFADYNFDWGKETTSHLGSLNTVFSW